ncbi:MAG: ABC transporter substrate-binding protein [Bacilli bacterium]|nr:ABC transporter substrate-binding protein [Bacilli bacterium]
MKKLFKLFIICSISFLLFGCNKDDNKLIMVTEAGFAPYEYHDGSGIVGVDVDIAREIAAAMGKELEIKDVAFDSLINELNSGKADFAAAGMSITEERKKEVDFSIEYVSSKQVVVVRKDYNKIKSVNDLNGKTISVQLGSVADTYVTKNFKNSKIVRQKKFLSAAEDVKAKKSECIIMDELPAKELVKNNSELTILKIELFTDKYAIAVKKGNTELLNKINEVLEKLIEEGKIEEFVINHSS